MRLDQNFLWAALIALSGCVGADHAIDPPSDQGPLHDSYAWVKRNSTADGSHPYEGAYIFHKEHPTLGGYIVVIINDVSGNRVEGCHAFYLFREASGRKEGDGYCFTGKLDRNAISFPISVPAGTFMQTLNIDPDGSYHHFTSTLFKLVNGSVSMVHVPVHNIIASVVAKEPVGVPRNIEDYPRAMLWESMGDYVSGHMLIGGYFGRPYHRSGGAVGVRIERVNMASRTASGTYAGYLIDPRTKEMRLTEFPFTGSLSEDGKTVTFSQDGVEYRLSRFGGQHEFTISNLPVPGGSIKLAKHVKLDAS